MNSYFHFLQEGLRYSVRKILKQVATQGLDSIAESFEHLPSLYITFASKQAHLPENIKKQYPDFLTIVLEHEFWNLKVFETYFEVELIFDEKKENIKVPFGSLKQFEDRNKSFLIELSVDEKASLPVEPSSKIISLDDFRDK